MFICTISRAVMTLPKMALISPTPMTVATMRLLVVVVDERLCLGMVGIQSLLDCGLGVVCPLVQVAAAGIALSCNLWLIE